ncbi:MAG TPA: type 1 glutamine amidotransferase domain-containing protein [Nannocystaceae bacterium]|nr:type 1 glutamine amidotransferase domain-containing protein [Nannocystaceae bacterium]
MAPTILTIVTNAKQLHLTDGTEYPSGFWAEELAIPYARLREAGFAIDIATIDGVAPSVDASSLDPDNIRWVVPDGTELDFGREVARYREILAAIPDLRAPKNLADLDAPTLRSYAGIYIAGGHGCMTDMPSHPQIARVLLRALDAALPIASVCHGPTAFLAPRDAEGRNPFAGYRFTCFSQTEETRTPIWGRLPMVIEHDLVAQGLRHSKAAAPWGSHVVRDRNLVTGQNPYSSAALADAFVALLAERTHP